MSHQFGPHRRFAHLFFAAMSTLPIALLAKDVTPVPTAGITPTTAIVVPAKPLGRVSNSIRTCAIHRQNNPRSAG
ncbi:MAG TPA: hypothetical protein VGC19_16100 [Rhodanobacter sp.]